MRTRIICDSCRKVFSFRGSELAEQELEQVNGLVTLSGLCPDCSRALEKTDTWSPS